MFLILSYFSCSPACQQLANCTAIHRALGCFFFVFLPPPTHMHAHVRNNQKYRIYCTLYTIMQEKWVFIPYRAGTHLIREAVVSHRVTPKQNPDWHIYYQPGRVYKSFTQSRKHIHINDRCHHRPDRMFEVSYCWGMLRGNIFNQTNGRIS